MRTLTKRPGYPMEVCGHLTLICRASLIQKILISGVQITRHLQHIETEGRGTPQAQSLRLVFRKPSEEG